MRVVEIKQLENGSHGNMESATITAPPDGWAMIPTDMVCENFPFGELEAEEINGIMTVTKWTPGVMPEPSEPVVPQEPLPVRVAELETEAQASAKLSAQLTVAAQLVVQESTTITDSDALKMPDLFKTWEEVLAAGKQLAAETVLNKDSQLYRVKQAVTPVEHQPPGSEGMLAIYAPIDREHAGTRDDPIPWVYGMDCREWLYYSYDGKVWLCVGDMIPCTWAPGAEGVWQWTEVVG